MDNELYQSGVEVKGFGTRNDAEGLSYLIVQPGSEQVFCQREGHGATGFPGGIQKHDRLD